MSTVYEQFQDILKSIDAVLEAAINQELVIQKLKGVIPEGYQLTIEEKAEGAGISICRSIYQNPS